MSASFEVRVEGDDLKKFRRGLSLLIRAGQRPGPILLEVGQVLEQSTWERWGREVDPDGQRWAELSPSTIANKQARGRILKILQSTGRLRHSITHQLVAGDAVAVGTNVEYADIHQFGRPGPWIIKAKKGKALFWPGAMHPVKQVTHPGIKARPFLGFSKPDQKAVDGIIRRRIREAMGQ